MGSARSPNKNILVVEDDPDIRAALTQILSDDGYAVATAANGQEAIDHLRRTSPPALILLDLMMPVMDGWQFRSHQKQDPALKSIPVVIVTADGSAQNKA